MRCLSWAFWPSRAERRSSNSLRSFATATLTDGSFGAGKQLRREYDRFRAIALGFKPGFACSEFIEAFGDDGQSWRA